MDGWVDRSMVGRQVGSVQMYRCMSMMYFSKIDTYFETCKEFFSTDMEDKIEEMSIRK